MPERLFPTLDRTDLIVHSSDRDLPRALMDTDATPEPGTTVELETGATVTFQGSVVFAGEPGPDAHLFDIDGTADGDGKAITAWITGLLEDDPFARLETPQGLVDPETDDLGAALDPPQAAD